MDIAPKPPIERVRIERRGGFAGLRPSVDCAYAALSAAQQGALHGVLAACAGGPPSPGADRFAYRVEVVHGSGPDRTLDLPEDAMPAALAALVRPTLP